MICVDASVAAKWILSEEHSERALALYAESVQVGEPVVAPALLPFEIANILRLRMVRDNVSFAQAQQLMEQFQSFPLRYPVRRRLGLRALELASTYNLPAVYDAHYLALAQLLSCPFWTDDRRLLRNLAGRLDFVRWIGDFTLP